MSIKVDLTSSDVDRQIELLKEYPEIADKYYRPALQRDVKILADLVKPNIPKFTGRAAKAFRSSVLGKGTSITGEVGWFRRGGPFYIAMVEGGAKAHPIEPRGGHGKLAMKLGGMKSSDFALHWWGKDGNWHFRRGSFMHPGISARGFMHAAWERAQPLVTHDLAMADEAIVKELAVP